VQLPKKSFGNEDMWHSIIQAIRLMMIQSPKMSHSLNCLPCGLPRTVSSFQVFKNWKAYLHKQSLGLILNPFTRRKPTLLMLIPFFCAMVFHLSLKQTWMYMVFRLIGTKKLQASIISYSENICILYSSRLSFEIDIYFLRY
jgi:hypothetical protein